VWNRQRTGSELADPANTSLGRNQVPRWNLPDGRIIVHHPSQASWLADTGATHLQDASGFPAALQRHAGA
jgi:hypothetical protein